jgi:CubicO group peptidase (beta-lactamase class C family)
MKKIFTLFVFGFLIIGGLGVTSYSLDIELIETKNIDINDSLFNLKISFLMRLARLPSLSACIIKDDEVLWSNSYGFYNLEKRKLATENTVYNIGSISKTITGTALMQLWEQDLFELDEDVNNYLPFNLRNPYFPDDPITFRMLLSHTSSLNSEIGDDGIKYYFWFNFSGDPPFSFYPNPWLKEHLLPGGKWYFPDRWSSRCRPGHYAMYANINFDLVAYLVEIISGESFLEYCNEHIFSPLEMYNTSFNLSVLDIEHVAIPYHWHNSEYLYLNELSYYLGDYTPPDKYWRLHCYPVGGLYTTVSDLSHFFIAHMNGGIWKDVRILEEETINEMHQIQPGNKIGYGLAWQTGYIAPDIDVIFSGHSGGNAGVHCWMFFIPYDNIGVIYFTNGDTYWEQFQILRLKILEMIIISFYNKGGYNLVYYIDLGWNFLQKFSPPWKSNVHLTNLEIL